MYDEQLLDPDACCEDDGPGQLAAMSLDGHSVGQTVKFGNPKCWAKGEVVGFGMVQDEDGRMSQVLLVDVTEQWPPPVRAYEPVGTETDATLALLDAADTAVEAAQRALWKGVETYLTFDSDRPEARAPVAIHPELVMSHPD